MPVKPKTITAKSVREKQAEIKAYQDLMSESDESSLDKLTDRQRLFAIKYCACLNQRKAAKYAGYHPDTGFYLCQNPHVKAYIDDFFRQNQVSAEKCIGLLTQMMQFDITDFQNEDGYFDLTVIKNSEYSHLIDSLKIGKDGIQVKVTSKAEALKIVLNVLGKLNPKDAGFTEALLLQQQRNAEKEAELQERELRLIQKEQENGN